MHLSERTYLSGLGGLSRLLRRNRLGALLRITRDLGDCCFAKLHRYPLKARADGCVLHGQFRHRSFLHHISEGNYEPMTVELFKQHLRPGMTVIDGGAHIGFFSLLAAQRVGPQGRVWSFEPDPYNFRCLLFNVEINRCWNVEPVQKLLSDTVGSVSFFQSSGTISSSLGDRSEQHDALNGASVKKVVAQSTTLDAELDGARADLIKLDIEGAEPLALRGMVQLLQRQHRTVLFAEINPSALKSVNATPAALIRTLKELAFEIYFIDEAKRCLLPVTHDGFVNKGNLYCTRGV